MTSMSLLLLNYRHHLARSLALIPLALSLFGCGGAAPLETSLSDERPPTLRALEPQRFDRDTLTEGVIEVVVPAGEWRMLFALDLDPNGLFIASLPTETAEPYVGIGRGPDNGQMTFIALPEQGLGVVEVLGFLRSALSTGDERALLFGSNVADTRFVLGYLATPPELTREDVVLTPIQGSQVALPDPALQVAELEARPRLPARFEAGADGFAGSVMRVRRNDGSILEYQAGRLRFDDLTLLSVDPGANVLGHYRAQVDEVASRPGVGSSQALGIVHSGQTDYDVNYRLSPFDKTQIGGGVGLGAAPGGFVLPTSYPGFFFDLIDPGLPNLGTNNFLLHFYWTDTEPGPLTLDLNFRFNGRQAERISPVDNNVETFTTQQFVEIFWVSFGYAAADLPALYGWQMDRDFGL